MTLLRSLGLRFHLSALLTAMVVLLGGLFGLITWWDYRATMRAAEDELGQTARLMEEHLRRTVQLTSVHLTRVQEMIGDRPLSALRGSRPDHQRLRTIIAAMPALHSAWILDPEGRVVLSSVQPDGPFISLTDRAFYQAALTGQRADYVSPLIWGKVTGSFLFPISRRLERPDGSFAGVIALSVDANAFLDLYREVSPRPGAVFTVIREDGYLVVRSPLPERDPGPIGLESKLFRQLLPTAQVGTYRNTSLVDDVDRLIAYRKMRDMPLVVGTGLAVEEILAPWRDRTLRNGLLGLVTMAALLVAGGMTLMAMQREERARANLDQRAADLRRALADKEVLFKEVHHRVNNNLQIISSLLSLRSARTRDQTAREALLESLERIQSMGMVHRALYEQDEASAVQMDDYLHSLTAALWQSHGAVDRGIRLELDVEPLALDLAHAMPLALTANEVLTNALKHGFPDGRTGLVRVSLRCDHGRCQLGIRDDGVGLDTTNPIRRPGSGMGLDLIRALAAQINGDATFLSDQGTQFTLDFPLDASEAKAVQDMPAAALPAREETPA